MPQPPGGERDVAPQGLGAREADGGADVLADAVGRTEAQPRLARGLRLAGAVAARGLRAHLEVMAQLLLEVAVELRPAEEQDETAPERGRPGAHAVSMHARDRRGEGAPAPLLGLEPPPAAHGEAVEARTAVVLREAPLRAHLPRDLEASQRGVERALLDAQHLLRGALDVLRDPPPVVLAAVERPQDQHVERALHQLAGEPLSPLARPARPVVSHSARFP